MLFPGYRKEANCEQEKKRQKANEKLAKKKKSEEKEREREKTIGKQIWSMANEQPVRTAEERRTSEEKGDKWRQGTDMKAGERNSVK